MMRLNQRQQQVVKHQRGALLVVAGAGTGKTSVITERILRLLKNGVKETEILALTFTEKAAYEMLDRVTDGLEKRYGHELSITTFNAFGAGLLEKYGVEIGLGRKFKLIGDQGKLVVLRENLDQLELDYFAPVSDPTGQLGQLAQYFSLLKQQLVQPKTYADFASRLPTSDDAERLEKTRHIELARAFSVYQKICRQRSFIDYDDQIYLSVQLLEQRPNILRTLQQTYKHILVDEFQDTNPMQSRLINLLAKSPTNISLMVVGDDDQSIYGWRGATLTNILNFQTEYPDCRLVSLVENYRSTQEILDGAYKLITNNNPERLEIIHDIDKKLVASRGKGTAPKQMAFSDFDSELDWVCKDIQEKIERGVEPGEIVVLARRAHGVQKAHDLFELHGLTHTAIGMVSNLYDQPIVQSMVQALKAACDPTDNMAVYHTLASTLFSIDVQLLSRLSSICRRRHISFEEALQQDSLPEAQEAFRQLMQWQSDAGTLSVRQLSYRIMSETGLLSQILDNAEVSIEGAQAAQSLFQWFKTLADFERTSAVASAPSYLAVYDTLQADGELFDEDLDLFDKSAPVVMTVHKAKGLEWQHVYIIDCTEGSFPLQRRGSSLTIPEELAVASAADDHYHEERRLMYVAMTRARDSVVCTLSASHNNGTSSRKPSRFMGEAFDTPATPNNSIESNSSHLEIFDQRPVVQPQLPEKLFNGQELILSATQISDYLRCPLDFYYRHVIGVPPEPSPQAAVGTLLHELIQRINTARIKGETVPTKDSLLSELITEWPIDDYLSKQQRQRAMDFGKEAFSKLYDRLLSEAPPVASEKKFRVRIPDSRLVIVGRIDAIYNRPNGLEVRDYKTSIVRDNKAAKQKTTASKQLELYALAYFIDSGEMPIVVSLDFVQSNIVGTVKKQAKTIENLITKLKSVADDILAENFPRGSDHQYCRHS